jgi:hypothetical protein
MSFVFPTNPTPGDTYTGPNSVEYTWDGIKWVGIVASTGGGGGDGLLEVETTVTDADVLLAVNTHNVLTIAGLTALRTALFPAGVKGDVIEVELATDAPADYELIIAGDTGVSMRLRDADAVTAAELTRMFIRGEAMRFVHDGTDWACTALDDGRIPSKVRLYLSTASSGPTATWVQPTDHGGAWTKEFDIGNVGDVSSGGITTRRSGLYRLFITYKPNTNAVDQESLVARLWSPSSDKEVIYANQTACMTSSYQFARESDMAPLGARESFVYQFFSNKGARGASNVIVNKTRGSYFSVTEIF